MKTKRFFARIFLPAVMILLASCTTTEKQDYINVIPADASMVVSFDIQSLQTKSAIPESDKAQIQQKILESVKNDLDAATVDYVDKIIKNPEETGISNTDKLYIFMGPKFTCNIVVKVTDINKLKAGLKVMENSGGCLPLTEKNGYSETVVNEQVLVAFNDQTLLISPKTGFANMSGGQTPEGMAKLMNLDIAASILSNKGFDKLNREQNDIAIFMCIGTFIDIYANILSPEQMKAVMQQMPEGMDMKAMYLLGSVNFEKGRIAIKTENYTNDEKVKAFYEKQKAISGKLKSTFLNCFPATSLLFISANLNGEELYKYLQTMPGYAEALKSVGKFDVQQLIGSLNGDITLGMTSLSPQGIPYITAYAQVKNDYVLQVMKQAITEGAIGVTAEPAGENAFVFKSMGLEVYAGMNKDYFYVTTDPQVFKSVGADVTNPMSKAVWGANAKNSYSFVLLNIADIIKQPLVAMALSASGKPEMQGIYSILSGCSYIEAFAPDFEHSEMNIVLTNQNDNALKQIAAGISKFTQSMQ